MKMTKFNVILQHSETDGNLYIKRPVKNMPSWLILKKDLFLLHINFDFKENNYYLIEKFVIIFYLIADSWIITSKASNCIHVIICD